MKKIFLVATALAMFSCSQKEPVTVTICNPLSIDRNGGNGGNLYGWK